MSSFFTSSSKSPNNLQWDCWVEGALKWGRALVCGCVCVYACVCMYVYMYVWKQWEADWRNLQLWCTISLWGKNPELNWCKASLKSNYVTDSARTDSDLESILILIWHFLPSWSNALTEKKKRQEIHNDDDVCQWLNESVFILIEQCYLTEVSFRYSPGKRMFEVFLFQKHSRLY